MISADELQRAQAEVSEEDLEGVAGGQVGGTQRCNKFVIVTSGGISKKCNNR